MKNFKKLFASLAVVAMLASTVPTAVLGATTYSSELQGAYDYAYGIGVTTQSSIDNANMFGSLIRSNMAKMMVNYAKEVKGLTADTTLACNFTDVANQTEEMQGYIKEACQMGLMGQGITAFNPNGIVTRAQFGTVLDRVLNGTANDGGNPYYADHLSALKDAGVMTNISTPNAPEVRGYVMLMMQRAANGGTTPATCDTPENQLSCSLGLSTCPAECVTTTPVVKAGDLNVTLNSNSPANGTQVPMAGTVKFATVNFAASSSNDVSLNTVQLSKVGLASIDPSTRIWFEKNGIRISGKAAFTSDGTAIISFAPQYVVKAGSTEALDLYAQLNTTQGLDIWFTSTAVGSTAQNVNGDFSTPVLRTADYTVATVAENVVNGGGNSYTDISNPVELGAFSLLNNGASDGTTRDVNFQSITLRLSGAGHLQNLSNITLERNGVVVASNPTINNTDLTFSVGDKILNGQTATYYIKATVNTVENATDDYTFTIRNTTDINIGEVSTMFRTTNTLTSLWVLGTYNVKGGDLSFTRDTTVPLSMNYAAGSQVVLMKGSITAKSAVTLEDINALGYTGTYPSNDLSKFFSTIYLTIGNSTFSYSPVSGQTYAVFYGSTTVNGTAQVKMYATLKDTAPAGYVKFNDLKLTSFATKTYVSNGNDVTTSGVGSIGGIQTTVQAAALNITKTDGLGATALAAGSNGVTVYGLSLASTQGNGLSVSNLVLNLAGYTTGFLNNAYLTLYINGTAIQSKTVTSTSVTFDGFNKTITPTAPMNVVVKADFVDAFNTGTFQATLATVNAYDTLTSNAIATNTYAKPAGAVFTIGTAVGTLSASNSNPLAQLLLSPSTTNTIGAFKLSATNDSISLYDVALTGTNLDSLSNFRLANADGTVIATATSTTSTAVVFSQINNAPVVAKDTSASYLILADTNSNTDISPISTTVTIAGTDIKGSNGNTIAVVGNSAKSSSHALAQNVATFAQVANPSKALTTSALRFSVTAAGKTSVTLTGLNFTNSLAGYTGTILVSIYKTSVAAGNLAGQASVTNGTAQFVPMTSNSSINSIIDAGSTVNYIVAIEGALVDPTSNSQDRNVTLNNGYFGGIAAASYTNLGAFPFTSVK